MLNKTIQAVFVAAAFAATPVFAAPTVSEVDVSVDMGAIQNAKAAEVWANLPDDLTTQIVARLGGAVAEDGSKITIDIDEVSLANTFEEVTNIADARLMGSVSVTNMTDNTKFDGYDLTVAFNDAGAYIPAGTDLATVTTDSKAYYDAMVGLFADHVVKNLK